MKKILTGLCVAALSACAAGRSPAPAPTHLSSSSLSEVAAAQPVPAPATGASAVSSAPAIPKQTHDDIITLLNLTFKPRMTEMTGLMTKIYLGQMRTKYKAINAAIIDEITQDVAKSMDTPERVQALEVDLVPIYAQAYTDDEVRQIIAFGRTPAGAKMFAGNPSEKQLAAAMQPWALGVLSPVLLMETARVLKAHGITMDQ